jgi:hypothetical protein
MKLKHILYTLLTFLFISFLYSCNSNDTYSYGPIDYSADAQIYSFSLKGNPVNKTDTANYTVLKSTFFHIDPKTNQIYNTDSLPYRIRINYLTPSLSYSKDGTPSKAEVVYRNLPDSVVELADGDSIDFSRNDVSIRVTAENGTSSREYKVNLAIHQINPDSIAWKQTSLSGIISGNGKEKVLLKDSYFYRYFLSGGSLTLQTAEKTNANSLTWVNKTITGLNNSIRLNDITILDDTFYAIDSAGKAYSSSDGVDWDESASTIFVYRVIGILPEINAENDSLVVVTKEGSEYYLEKTKDFETFKRKTIINNTTVFDKDNFLKLLNTDYSSMTYYNRDNVNSNLLSIIGPRTSYLEARNGWILISNQNGLSIVKSGNEISSIDKSADFSAFIYDKKFFALSKDAVYTSVDWGKQWVKGTEGYSLANGMKTNPEQSIIVDENDFIWIFGRMNSQYVVWRGRLNSLIK